jgi:hypothetical protein
MSVWVEQNWDFASKYCYHLEGEDERWAHLVCPWYEKKDDKTEQNGKIVIRRVIVKNLITKLIDLRTGQIWLDVSYNELYLKFCAQIVLRPIHTLGKTLYHICIPFSIPCEIYFGIQEGINNQWSKTKTLSYCIERILKSFADIIRTPLYGTLLTVHAIGVLILAPYKPKTIFSMMATSGKIEEKLFWEVQHAPGTLFNCFQPWITFDELKEKWVNKQNLKDTEYRKDKMQWALSNYGRAFIREHRRNPPCKYLKHFEEVGRYKAYVSHNVNKLRPLTPPKASLIPNQKAMKRIGISNDCMVRTESRFC